MAHLYLRRQISGISITVKSGCSVSARRSASAASRFLGCKKDPWEEKIYYARSQVPAPVQHRVDALGIPALQNRPRARSIKNKYYGYPPQIHHNGYLFLPQYVGSEGTAPGAG